MVTPSFASRSGAFRRARGRKSMAARPVTLALGIALVAPVPVLFGSAHAESPAGMAVSVVRAKRECFSDVVRVAGAVVPKEELHVRPDVEAARVAQVLVDTGDPVSAGQVLARLARSEGMNVPAQALSVQAPAAGTVGRIMTQVGAMASMGGPPMFLLIGGGEFELQAEIPSTRIGKIAEGQSAKVDIAGVGTVAGQVRSVSPEISIASQTGSARISLKADKAIEKRLRMGAFGRATVEVGTSCGTSVPLSAVLYGPLGPVVQVVHENRVETRPVPIGLLSGGNVEIKQGLAEGDLVVKRAGTFLREGDRVRPFVAEDAGARR